MRILKRDRVVRSGAPRLKNRQRETLSGLLFFLPWVIGFLAITCYPLIYSIVISFNQVAIRPGEVVLEPVGWEYFRQALFLDTEFPTLLVTSVTQEAISSGTPAAQKAEVSKNTLALLKSRFSSAKTLLYVHDNCGEVVFDKIFIRVIKKLYPQIAITSLVRGGEIINDATRIDADFIGLSKYAAVQDSGEAVPGTYLKELAPQALALFENSDVIISKGLGNLETLHGEGYDIFYIFMCKCAHIAKRFGYLQWQTAFVHEGK